MGKLTINICKWWFSIAVLPEGNFYCNTNRWRIHGVFICRPWIWRFLRNRVFVHKDFSPNKMAAVQTIDITWDNAIIHNQYKVDDYRYTWITHLSNVMHRPIHIHIYIYTYIWTDLKDPVQGIRSAVNWVPSGNQSSQWKIHDLWMILPSSPPFFPYISPFTLQ